MRKVIAHLLVYVMFITAFQNVVILKAAPNTAFGFEITRQMLKEDTQGLSVAEREENAAETALGKWDGSTAGKYNFSYYIEVEGGITKKVDLNFDNKDKTNIDLDITVSTAGTRSKVCTPLVLNTVYCPL